MRQMGFGALFVNHIDQMNIDRSKQFARMSEQLNKSLGKALESFSHNTAWSDIPNWLANVQSLLREYPSPFIGDKVLLSKRLNQCMNPILPEKVHQTVIRIHQTIFKNMKQSVEGNINEYIHMFAEDLGVYSLSLLPHFVHTSIKEQRVMILRLINLYYLDMGKELIPMLSGLLKTLFSVYSNTINAEMIQMIEFTLTKILISVGRRYVVGTTWSLILRYKDCKQSGIKFLTRVIDRMEVIKGEEELDESRGFSEIQQQLIQMERLQNQGTPCHNERYSHEQVLKHLEKQESGCQLYEPDSNSIPLYSPNTPETEVKPSEFQNELSKEDNVTRSFKKVESISEEVHEGREQLPEIEKQQKKQINSSEIKNSHKSGERSLFQSQAPFSANFFKEDQQIILNAVPLMVSPGIQTIREGIDDPNVEDNNFPHIGSLVVNALISSLEQDESRIQRTALDFMQSHLRIKSQRLGEKERSVLVEALLRLFHKKDSSLTKRANRWLFGKEDEEGRYIITDKNQFVVDYIIKAFRQILQTVPTSEENCTYPIKILQNFYIEHPHLVKQTLSHISLELLRYIFNFGRFPNTTLTDHKQDTFEDVLKVGKRFLQNLPSFYHVILTSLGNSFVEAIQKNEEESAFQAVKYTDFCYINLMKHEHNYEELQYITMVLNAMTEGLAIIARQQDRRINRLFLKDAVLLVYNLLERRRGVIKINRKEEESINQKYFIQNGTDELPPERVSFLQELRAIEREQQKKYLSINDKMQQFFIQLGYIVKTYASIRQYEEIFKLSSLAMVCLQVHLPPEGCSELPKWFGTLEGGIKVANPLVSLAAIEAMIKCLMWEGKHPIYSSFKTVLLQEKASRQGTDYQKLALQKLWSLLDYPHMHTRIIDLIVSFSKYFPYEFAETVKRSFSTLSAPDKEASIQRFSHFWRLTAYKYKDLLANQEFAELNKVGLFRMLDFLDDPNPLVRHAAKSWLMESMVLLRRVIEPLLLQLIMGCAQWYETPKGLLLIQTRYDTSLIFSTFRRIRAILSNGSYTFLRFVYQAEITEQLDEQKQKVTQKTTRLLTVEQTTHQQNNQPASLILRQPVLPKSLENTQKKEVRGSRLSYLDLLLILAVKYIEGHAVESMGIDFYVGNAGVNASAVELIETLLDYVDNWELCQKVLDYLLDYLFRVLGQVVLNREYIMQIQILNLLRNIFLNSSFRKKAPLQKVRAFFKTVFTNPALIKALLDGLNTPFAYVRSQFIAFITLTTPLIADFLDPDNCTRCVRHILFSYYKIIKTIGGNLAHRSIEELVIEEENAPATMRRVAELSGKLKGEERLIKFRDNLQQAGRANQMLSVLQGVESILNYFYDLDKVDPKQLNFQFSNPYTLFDTFKSILTLGLASSSKRPKLVERRNFLHNFETCQALLKDLEPVYQTILRAWPLSEEFVRIGSEEFSSMGMHSFNFQRFSRYNKVVKELIEYVEEEKESIWGKIYSIMQPLFCRFPKEIIDIYLKLWIRECSDLSADEGTPRANSMRTQLLMKIMETIIVNNFPCNVVIHAFLESTAMEELGNYYKLKGQNKKAAFLDYQMDKTESKLLYFLYVYFNYVYLNEKELTYEPLLEVWSLIMKVLQPFQQSETPLASIWILEIVNLCAKKYSPKELIKNQRFKTDLHGLINHRLKHVASIAARKQVFCFDQPIPNVNYEEAKVPSQQYHIVLPLPPTIYDIFKKHVSHRNHSDLLALKEYRPGQQLQIEARYRIYCFKILKSLGLQILQNTYLPEKIKWVIQRTCQWMEIILKVIEDKSSGNQIFAECASQILHDLLEKARLLFIRELKQRVLDIFNKDDFFICNSSTLRYWSDIIDWVVSLDKNSQTYMAYLQKVTLSSSYFSSQSAQNKRRVKSFERICFILYAGCKDRYAGKLNVLLAKIVDVIKKPENVHAALLILILFAIRILILRLSEITLNQLFIDIWPMILTLLMQTFSKKLVRVHIQNQISKDPNYLLAALKLIEMISLNNLTQFASHQWIFVTDYFGVTFASPEITPEMKELYGKRPELASIIEIRQNYPSSPFIFKPALLNYLPQWGVSYIPTAEHQKVSYKASKRVIVVKESFIRDEAELQLNSLLLMQYMARLDQVRTEVDWKEVEDVIVNDFINLDSFIHQIN